MSLKSWLAKKSADKGRSNIIDALAKLVPACDKQWDRTTAAMEAQQWPLPSQDPGIDRYRRDLLNCLLMWKGPLNDHEALYVVADTMAKLGARFGAQMAVRYIVMEAWPQQDRKLSLTQAEMEHLLGTREKDKEQQEVMRQYALHFLALEQAVKERSGGRAHDDDSRPTRPVL